MVDTPESDRLPGMFGMDMMTSITRASIKAMEDWNQEVARFVNYRLEKDIAFQGKVASCKSPAEFFEAYSTFMTQAMEDYASEMQRLQGMSADAATSSFNAAEDQMMGGKGSNFR